MRALTKTQAGPGLEMIDRPEPECGPSDVKVRVLRAGLCGTDLHLQEWDAWAAEMVRVPQTIGHEFYGEVVEVGADVITLRPGDRVSGEGHIVCGYCRNCRAGRRHQCINTVGLGVNRDGCFADYVVIPAANAWKQPSDPDRPDYIDPELGAVFDPFGNATHTALQWPLVGEDVLITGAGPIGVLAAAIAKHAGAKHVVVTDVSDYRLGLARQAGADLVVNVGTTRIKDAQRELGMVEGFDVALEMSGSPAAVEELLANMNHGAKVAMLGLPKNSYPIDWGRVITHMITLKGIYGREMFETWYLMNSMLATSQTLKDAVRSVITHRFSAEDWADAFDAARSGQCGKVIMDWS
ncbi:L-threonine 3-dehydrogenase [Nigerium massiliense]|uniref:L-threonine 3-dehydrogenase n=1 Tax=Nigerium massiliense TaxID=1522317 RepID=UPI0005914D3E|nr:L-threonine 3-dehydrogenase [Nigerium massiliense]